MKDIRKLPIAYYEILESALKEGKVKVKNKRFILRRPSSYELDFIVVEDYPGSNYYFEYEETLSGSRTITYRPIDRSSNRKTEHSNLSENSVRDHLLKWLQLIEEYRNAEVFDKEVINHYENVFFLGMEF